MKELAKYGSCLKAVVSALHIIPFLDKHTEEVFVRRMLEETENNPIKVSLSWK